MTRKLPLVFALIFLISLGAKAQDKVEIFGGYSYQRFGSSPASNLNGTEFSGQYKLVNFLGAVADIDAHFGSPSHIDTKTVNVMFGPQISLPARISPFFHVMAGIGHIRVGGVTDTSFATAVGGGIDMRIVPLLSWRVIQADDVVTRFFGRTQNSPRISTGVVFHF